MALYFLDSQCPLQKTLKGGAIKWCWEQGTRLVSLKGETPCLNISSPAFLSAARGLERQWELWDRSVSFRQLPWCCYFLPCKEVFSSYWRPQELGMSLYALLKFYHTFHLNNSRIKFQILVLLCLFLEDSGTLLSPIFSSHTYVL